MGNREEKSKKQREAILRASVSVFSHKGFHKASVEEIAKRASVGKGTIYLYFDDKSQLFAAAVAEGIESIIAQLRAALESELPFLQHLKKLVEKNISLYLEYGDLTTIFHNELSSGIKLKSRNQIDQARSRYLEFIAETLADGHLKGYVRKVDFHLAAVGIVGLLDNLCNHKLRNMDKVNKEQIANIIFDLLATGLISESRQKKVLEIGT